MALPSSLPGPRAAPAGKATLTAEGEATLLVDLVMTLTGARPSSYISKSDRWGFCASSSAQSGASGDSFVLSSSTGGCGSARGVGAGSTPSCALDHWTLVGGSGAGVRMRYRSPASTLSWSLSAMSKA